MAPVGIMYSVQAFLEFCHTESVEADAFLHQKSQFELASPQDVFNCGTRYGWVALAEDGMLRVTSRGSEILECDGAESRLRAQVVDVIAGDFPTWAERAIYGRDEAVSYCGSSDHQVLKEAGLLNPWDDELILWWDQLASRLRMAKSQERLRTGRIAEAKSMKYEERRTGSRPLWASLDSSFFGYDVLSIAERGETAELCIEVKGSERSSKDADFVLTVHEWRTASRKNNYNFHLWSLNPYPRLFVVTIDDVRPHVPTNCGRGRWEAVRIPFGPFQRYEIVDAVASAAE